MAKQNQLKLALVIALTMSASSALASPTAFSGATSVGGTSFSSSNKVYVWAATNGTTGSFDGGVYSIRSAHLLGDKTIASASGDARIYFQTTTPGNPSLNSAAATGNVYSSSTVWSSM